MSKSKLRKDKTCLNCNYVVENKFCPNCGQENVDTRKTFHHLFVHFFEDLTHYENAFWKTIKNLLFKPASLTKEYLSGKRLSYLAPVRLYIFVSFITFFLVAVMPESEEGKMVHIGKNENEKKLVNINSTISLKDKNDAIEQLKKDSLEIADEIEDIQQLRKTGIITNKVADSLVKYTKEGGWKTNKPNVSFIENDFQTIAEMDSVRKINPEKINDLEYWFNKKTIPLKSKYKDEELAEKLVESISHNFPKALFIYMPLFAFALWLFHNKKRWYYFDHGIFTLHYFAFLLLMYLIIKVMDSFLGLFDNQILSILSRVVKIIGFIWMIYYFFPAHHRFYQETRFVSFVKSTVLFFINMLLATIVLAVLVLYSLVSIN